MTLAYPKPKNHFQRRRNSSKYQIICCDVPLSYWLLRRLTGMFYQQCMIPIGVCWRIRENLNIWVWIDTPTSREVDTQSYGSARWIHKNFRPPCQFVVYGPQISCNDWKEVNKRDWMNSWNSSRSLLKPPSTFNSPALRLCTRLLPTVSSQKYFLKIT